MLKTLFPLKKKGKSKKGFTLVELIIIIVLLVVLAGIAAFSIASWIQRGNEAAAHSEAEIALRAVSAEAAFRHARTQAGIVTTPPTVQFADAVAMQTFLLSADGMNGWNGAVTAGSIAANGTVATFEVTVNGFSFNLLNGRLQPV